MLKSLDNKIMDHLYSLKTDIQIYGEDLITSTKSQSNLSNVKKFALFVLS